MSSTPVEIVQAILQDPTNPDVVKPLVSPDAVYVSLSYDNPELKKLMPWAGTHTDGADGLLKTFQDLNTF